MEHFSVSKSFNLKSLSTVQNLTVEPFDLAQIINNFSKVPQKKKIFNLCWNGKGTMVYVFTQATKVNR
jgi:hypothetical protein